MSKIFEQATKAAIDEILTGQAQASRFGLLITPESKKNLIQELYTLVENSRNLKAAGDRLVSAILPQDEPQKIKRPARRTFFNI